MPTWGWIVVAAAGGLVVGAAGGFSFAAWLVGMDNPSRRTRDAARARQVPPAEGG
jgi:hypothetical protein